MARKTKTIVIEDEGRDKNKMFIINEMSASQAENWAMRCFLALARSGVELPDDLAQRGFAGIAILGLKALSQMNFYEAEPFLKDMMDMVSFVPDPAKPSIKRGYGGVGPIIESDIEEVRTRLMLRKEMLGIHVDFSIADIR